MTGSVLDPGLCTCGLPTSTAPFVITDDAPETLLSPIKDPVALNAVPILQGADRINMTSHTRTHTHILMIDMLMVGLRGHIPLGEPLQAIQPQGLL